MCQIDSDSLCSLAQFFPMLANNSQLSFEQNCMKEINISAELPGMDEKDVEVTVEDDVLTIQGEKKEKREAKDENKGYYIGIFNDRNVIVENIYPEIKDEVEDVECTLSKYQQSNFPENCGYFSIYGEIKDKEQSYSISLPVSLYFANLNQYRLGLVKIRNGD